MRCFHATGRSARRAAFVAAPLVAALTLSACGDDDPVTPAGPIDVSLAFAAEINGTPFACGQSYDNVGTSATTITPADFRFFIHGVRLLDAGGNEVEVELDQDGLWQYEDLALLDFADGTGPCANQSAATHTTIEGEAPAGDYTGIRFVLGVPFDLNHGDALASPPPLDNTDMQWNWNGGYKFVRIDHTSAAQPNGWNVHLGSTGCTPGGNPSTPAVSCANEHRVEVTFSTFDIASDVVVADLGRLLAGADVAVNAANTARGCMSFPGDADCPPVMNNFGLDYEGSVSSGQTFFSVR